MVTCPTCGEENPDRARFCLNCAAPLSREVRLAREVRKTVTIVFCDVTGSTALGDHLDPESLRKVMASYFEAMKQVLERHGGTIEKFIGDAVMAVFGIPTLHEDDALRAVRAAVEMRSALATLNQGLERNQGVTIEVRTGVNTGEVVAGDPSTGQALITGDAVNMAARLEQAARPGEILIGANTHRLVRDAIEAEPVEALAVKGKSTKVPAFRLHRVIAGASAFARTLDSEIVGRDHELKMLTEAYERAVREQSCHLFTVLGSAGVGKSRLVAEFLLSLGNGGRVLQGRCLPYGEGITFWPVAEVVRQAAAVDDRDGPQPASSKIASLLEGNENGAMIAEILSQAIGFKSAAASTEEIFWAVRKLLESLAEQRPLIVVFDDIHWAEPTFLDLLDHVADMSRNAPLLLLCIARGELLDQRRGWAGGKLNATSLFLEPLTGEECATLIENLLHRSELASETMTRVIEAGEGNPLFVQEMLAMMIDEGLLARANGRWKATKALSDISVPPTIQALLAARLDRLAEEERRILEAASVIGKLFWRGAVTAMLAEEAPPSIGACLSNLVRKDLIRPDASRFAGDDGFRFRHSLIRDAAYDSIAKRTRADMHERFARWLERFSAERIAEFEEILGYHLETANRYLLQLGSAEGTNLQRAHQAATYLSGAGRRASARGDVAAAHNLLERAASLLPADDAARMQLLPDLVDAAVESGDFTKAKLAVDEALALAETTGDRRVELRVRTAKLALGLQTNPQLTMGRAREEAEDLLSNLEEVGDDLGLGRCWYLLSQLAGWLGDFVSAERALDRASAHARKAGDHRTENAATGWMPLVLVFGPTHTEETVRRCDDLLQRFPERGQLQAFALVSRGMSLGMRGEFAEAHSSMARGRTMLQDLGMVVSWGATSFASATIDLRRDPAGAERELRGGYEVLERMGETGFLSTVAAFLAEALFQQGHGEEAEAMTVASETIAPSDDLASHAIWRTVRAKLFAGRGKFDQADALAGEAVEMLEPTDWLFEKGLTQLAHAEVHLMAHRDDRAAAMLQRARETFELKGATFWASTVRALQNERSN